MQQAEGGQGLKAAAQYHGLNDNTDEHCLH